MGLFIDSENLHEIQELGCRSQESSNLMKTLDNLNPTEKKALFEMMQAIERGEQSITVEELSIRELKELKQKLEPSNEPSTEATKIKPHFSEENLKRISEPISDTGLSTKKVIKGLGDLFQRDLDSLSQSSSNSASSSDTGISSEKLLKQIEQTKRSLRKRKAA